MKGYIINLFLCLLSVVTVNAEDVKSNTVLINDVTTFSILDKQNSIIKREYTALVKNKYGTDYKNIYLQYDKFSSVESAEVYIYDRSGEEVNKYKLRDFMDVANNGGSVAQDNRVKLLEPAYNKYPFTIKVSYEIKKTGSLFFPIWNPQDDENIEIHHSEFIVKDYTKESFRFLASNTPKEMIQTGDQMTTYTWKVDSLAAFSFESYNYHIEDYAPIIYTGPQNFSVEGFEGNMSSWEQFGLWAKKLNEGKNDLPSEAILDLKNQVASVTTEEEKVKIVYDYLQKNTRYVSIQLGIGGWQPFSSSFVHDKKYGDCKALSFYTQSLLEFVGIKSYYTLIKAGKYATEISNSFPSAHFNHAILTVPIQNDTLFLECTSQTNPFGYLGTFTSNRNALMITPDGGKLIRTKKYSPQDNLEEKTFEVNLNETGSAEISTKTIYHGIEIENSSFLSLYQKSEKEQKEWFYDNIMSGSQELQKFNILELKEGPVPIAGYVSKVKSEKEGKAMGKRLFISLDKYFDSYLSKVTEKKREKDIRIRYGFSQRDSLIINYPEQLFLESNQADINIETKFGSYTKKQIATNGKVIILRTFKLNDGIYPVNEFEPFKDFVNKVNKLDNGKLVLVNKS